MRIFFSYSSANKDFARRLAADLERAGIEVWLDVHALRVGTDLAGIEEEIRRSDCLVVVLSVASAESGWVDREIETAERFGVRVLPVLLETVHGRRQARFSGLSHADFRRPQDYRRATQRLIAAVEGTAMRERFLSAKEAAALVKAEWNPTGELFGISQQGVATLYCLANLRDWEFADTADGTGRFWITEFYDAGRQLIQAYAVTDGKVHRLPELYLYGTDPEPLSGSVTVYSCALNHLQTQQEAASMEEMALGHANEFTRSTRRYSRFRPIPLEQEFIDSPAAVAAATTSAVGSRGSIGSGEDLFVLAKLESDKRYYELPTWVVAFFDPTLSESVLTVGVDATTGVVRHQQMRTEILNADFMSMRVDEQNGNYVINIANQLRAMDQHVWDIPQEGDALPHDITAAEALSMAEKLLRETGGSEHWQVAFLSNTGVVRPALSPGIASTQAGLMKRGGRAGQWVVEVCGLTSTPVTEPGRTGHRYPYRQIVCTRSGGAVDMNTIDSLILTAALTGSPLPQGLMNAYESARKLAVRTAAVDFLAMSVALRRTPPEAAWHFRFYDAHDIVRVVTVSVDGRRLIAAGPPKAG